MSWATARFANNARLIVAEAGRWGIFGGSFDPPHNGHVFVARQAQTLLALERLLVVPTSANPLKNAPVCSLAQRKDLAQLLVDLLPQAELDVSEVERSGPAYTIDYLRAFAGRRPQVRPVLIVGMDAWQSFAEWREPAAILDLADVAVFRRGKVDDRLMLNPIQNIESLGAVCYHQGQNAADGHWSWQGGPDRRRTVNLWLLPGNPPDVSSTEVRRRLAAGKSIDELVPASIAAYIRQQQLYRQVL